MATPRNEHGLTVYQQERYNKIIGKIETVQEQLNPEQHVVLDLKNELTLAHVFERIQSVKDSLSQIEQEMIKHENFLDNENDIQINLATTCSFLDRINDLKRAVTDLGYNGSSLKRHALKLEKLEKIKERNKNKPDFKKEVLKDMLALENEFESVKFNVRSGHIYVTTKDIIMADLHGNSVNLGPFKLSYKTNESRLVVKAMALEPVTHQNTRHFHPHVESDGTICLGESVRTLRSAHKRGDLYSIFMVLKSTMETYNPDSPYARLETWVGTPCEHCGVNGSSERRINCSVCGDSVCGNCYTNCDYPKHRALGVSQFICSTCQTEEKNKCPGVTGRTCSQFINGTDGRYCYDCAREALRRGLETMPMTEDSQTAPESPEPLPPREIPASHETGPDGPTDPFSTLVQTVQTMEEVRPQQDAVPVAPPESTNNAYPGSQTCASCQQEFNSAEPLFCDDCGQPICDNCRRAIRCEDCGEHVCSSCRIPCSRCRTPVHLDCTTEDTNRNILCSQCRNEVAPRIEESPMREWISPPPPRANVYDRLNNDWNAQNGTVLSVGEVRRRISDGAGSDLIISENGDIEPVRITYENQYSAPVARIEINGSLDISSAPPEISNAPVSNEQTESIVSYNTNNEETNEDSTEQESANNSEEIEVPPWMESPY